MLSKCGGGNLNPLGAHERAPNGFRMLLEMLLVIQNVIKMLLKMLLVIQNFIKIWGGSEPTWGSWESPKWVQNVIENVIGDSECSQNVTQNVSGDSKCYQNVGGI
jgi:hypothetical protein